MDWPKKTVNAQKEWIGKSKGYEIDFKIKNSDQIVTVFTTKPGTINAVEFIAVSPSSMFADPDLSVTSEYFTHKYAINPVDGTEIPIYVANYIVEGYGTSSVMGVPIEDKRDSDFAIRHNIIVRANAFRENHIFEGNETFIREKINYKLRDWCVSRQRKWGCPIPIEGETDTLDTFVDSSFYFIRYCDAENPNELCNKEKYQAVDLYVGGNEHACMHLIYARFINMFLYDIGIVPNEEPFQKLIHQGMILNNSEKMSKSKGNVVNPDEYDSDELRFYLMFIGHYFDGGSWSDQNINGVKRFVNRFSEWMSRTGDDVLDVEEFQKKIFAYTESFKFNKVVSEYMTLYNAHKTKNLTIEIKKQLIDILRIYMPNIDSKINQFQRLV